MEKQLQIFKNAEFGEVRTVVIDNEPWFAGKDVAAALSYERGTKAVVDHVDEDDRKMLDSKTQSYFGIELGQRGGWLINESGLYSLILSSKLPTAKKFKYWVTSEVLPAIRKTGSYAVDAQAKVQERRLKIMENNAKIREAALWAKLAQEGNDNFKQVCRTYAANTLAEKEILALPKADEKTYTATEVASMLGVTAHKIGRIVNENDLKAKNTVAISMTKAGIATKRLRAFAITRTA